MQLYKEPSGQVPPFLAEKYDREAARYWDKFYRRNGANFFKDRHYLEAEFPELCQGGLTLLEVGCGAGNTVFPLLERHEDMRVFACDFSPTAVDLVKSHDQYDPDRITAFVADLTQEAPFDGIVEPESIDVVTMVFVLSAITPEKMNQAIANIRRIVRPGGHVLLRDYAEGDLAQLRLGEEGKQQRISDNFFVRGDGTCAYYFSHDYLRDLFKVHGFQCSTIVTHDRQIKNRAKSQVMERRWVQAVFSLRQPSTAEGGSNAMDPSSIRLVGAAGRLARLEDRPARLGYSLPDSLDPADVTAAEISPSTAKRGSMAEYEAQLEREFARAVGRDTDEVVAEEVAAMQQRGGGMQETHLAELEALTAVMDEMASTSREGGARQWGEMPELEAYTFGSGAACQSTPYMASPEPLYDYVSAGGVDFRLDAGLTSAAANGPLHVTVLGARPAVARWVAVAPSVFSGKVVLDLWCGGLPLCALLATRWCRYCVAAARNAEELSILKRNLFLNGDKFIIERAQPAQLEEGGCPRDASITKLASKGYDVVLSAALELSSVLAAGEAAASIFRTAAPLLAKTADAEIILAFTVQTAAHLDVILAQSAEYGFAPYQDAEQDRLLALHGINVNNCTGTRLIHFRRVTGGM